MTTQGPLPITLTMPSDMVVDEAIDLLVEVTTAQKPAPVEVRVAAATALLNAYTTLKPIMDEL
jgi:hypothetical protein